MYLKTISHQYITQFKSFEVLIEPVGDADAENGIFTKHTLHMLLFSFVLTS